MAQDHSVLGLQLLISFLSAPPAPTLQDGVYKIVFWTFWVGRYRWSYLFFSFQPGAVLYGNLFGYHLSKINPKLGLYWHH